MAERQAEGGSMMRRGRVCTRCREGSMVTMRRSTMKKWSLEDSMMTMMMMMRRTRRVWEGSMMTMGYTL